MLTSVHIIGLFFEQNSPIDKLIISPSSLAHRFASQVFINLVFFSRFIILGK